MKKILLSITILSIIFAQPMLAEDEFKLLEIEEESFTQTQDSKFNTWWNEHMSGKIGAMSAGAGDTTRSAFSAILGYEKKFSRGKFKLEGQVFSNRNETKFTRLDGNTAPNDPDEITLSSDSSESVIREAFIDYNFTDSLTLSLGRQTIVWGQFDLFSPIDFALPFDFSQSGLSFSKVDRRLPQDTAKLSWFMNPKTELQLYYFPDYPSDRVLESQSDNTERTVQKPSSDEDEQEAARLMFYQDWGTVGFTYYKGFDSFTSNLSTLTPDLENPNFLNFRDITAITEKTVYGIEVAKPIGKVVLKFELAREEGIIFEPDNFPQQGVDTDYINFVTNENNGELYSQADRYLFAAGFDADLENWLINFSVIGFTEELDETGERLKEFSDNVENADDDDDFDTNIFPIFNIARYLDSEKNARLGFGLGFLNQGMGISLYWTKEYQESLRLIAALEAIRYYNSFDEDIEGYEASEEFTSGLRIGALYSF